MRAAARGRLRAPFSARGNTMRRESQMRLPFAKNHGLLVLAAVGLGILPARAGVIDSYTTANEITSGYLGQSFTTPNGGPWDDITFNFFNADGDPIAAGTAYIFSAEYDGDPGGLSSASYLAASTGILDAGPAG